MVHPLGARFLAPDVSKKTRKRWARTVAVSEPSVGEEGDGGWGRGWEVLGEWLVGCAYNM